ncbi:hypothetical protein ACF1BE_06680 [Streptomyces sp. NPDC014991]|uniref:hypothetical protein n=1 Tax=Streptomyces sp. NPDC014991 TaxID=3364935 RepID=UPI003701E526
MAGGTQVSVPDEAQGAPVGLVGSVSAREERARPRAENAPWLRAEQDRRPEREILGRAAACLAREVK